MTRNIIAGLFVMTASVVFGQDYKKIHEDLLVVDAHNDVIISSILEGKDISQYVKGGHTDIPRLIEGGVDVQVFAVWSNDNKWKKNAFKHANDQIDALEKVVKDNPDKIEIIHKHEEVERLQRQGKIAAVIGIESGNMIESSIDNLVALHKRGAQYLTLTWNYNLPWATAAAVEDKKPAKQQQGLSRKGRKIIRKMNQLGMMIDLSHASKKTFYDVMKISKKPVLATHSNAAALTPHSRNLDDKQLAALKKNGGLVGVNFYSGFLDSTYDARVAKLYVEQTGKSIASNMSNGQQYEALSYANKKIADTPIENLLRHIDYLVEKLGIDHVAIGSDFDGIESAPQGLEDVSKFPFLTQSLLQRGYSQEDVAKIMGLNFMRVWKENTKN